MSRDCCVLVVFFFNDTATTEIYTLSLHDALPISSRSPTRGRTRSSASRSSSPPTCCRSAPTRSEEHTSELQSQFHLVCRLLLEKKKNKMMHNTSVIRTASTSSTLPLPTTLHTHTA